MPFLLAEIEEETPVVSNTEKTKLLEYVVEEDVQQSDLVEDIRIDDFSDILSNIKKRDEEKKKREEDGTDQQPPTQTQTTSSADPSTEIKKEDAKEKSATSPEKAPEKVDNSGAQTEDAVKEAKISATPVSTGIRVTSYLEQGKIGDNSYWAYRKVDGPGTYVMKKDDKIIGRNTTGGKGFEWEKSDGSGVASNEKNTAILAIKGYVKYRFGANWNTLTQGIPIKSIWDVVIAINVPQVGIFNPKIPYVAEENTEQHMMILNDNMVFDRGKGTAIGLYSGNPSWAHEPYWCGAWTDFLTNRAGLSRDGGGTVGVDAYHRSLSAKGLVNAPTTGIKNNKGKIKFQDSWLPSATEAFNSNGVGAVFVKGYHFQENGPLTDKGKKLINYLLGLDWGMATVSVGTSTHVETCAYLQSDGTMISIGGNTSGGNDRNGTQIAIKSTSISNFCGKKRQYVVFGKISGDTNRTVSRLNAKYKMTETMKKYIDAANSKGKNISTDLAKFLKSIT